MKAITIEVIPHAEQSYDTPGDWKWNGDELKIFVSDTGVPRYNVLLALHEMVEALLCNFEGVTGGEVDLFDLGDSWAKRGFTEPGADPQAPYHIQHMFAESIEQLMAWRLNADWAQYGDTLVRLNWHAEEDPQNERPSLWARSWCWIRGGEGSICSVCGTEEGSRHDPLLHMTVMSEMAPPT